MQHKETVKVMVELLKHPIFMMFAVSNFFTSLGYPIPYTFVPVSIALSHDVYTTYEQSVHSYAKQILQSLQFSIHAILVFIIITIAYSKFTTYRLVECEALQV